MGYKFKPTKRATSAMLDTLEFTFPKSGRNRSFSYLHTVTRGAAPNGTTSALKVTLSSYLGDVFFDEPKKWPFRITFREQEWVLIAVPVEPTEEND